MSKMLVAREDFRADYDGEILELRAGRDRVSEDHELAVRHPGRFGPVPADSWPRPASEIVVFNVGSQN